MNNFNAAQFYDFTKLSDSGNESDNDFDANYTDKQTLRTIDLNVSELQVGPDRNSLRRSMSFGDLHFLRSALENNDIERAASVQESVNEAIVQSPQNSTPPKDAVHSPNKPRPHKKTFSEESLDRLSKPRHHSSDISIHRKGYVSMAEAVQKFHTKTPDRYRVQPSAARRAAILCQNGNSKESTKPMFPLFKTDDRLGIMVKQMAGQKLQQHEKFKIKPNPVNNKIIQGPIKPTVLVEKPPVTVSKPCTSSSKTSSHKITESPKRANTEFRAQPVPKAVLQQPKSKFPLLRLPERQTTASKQTTREQETKKPQSRPANLQRTKPLPFSFEVRDRMMKAKKDMFIRRILEEEKRAREFHAKPIPKAVLEPSTNAVILPKNRAIKTTNKASAELQQPTQFKARPATVVHKKPFVPSKTKTTATATAPVCPFKLQSQIRAEKREVFDKYLLEKEAEKARQKQEEEEQLRAIEEEEVKKLRKLTEYKAQPVRKYKEVLIVPSGKVTVPKTPSFCTKRLFRQRRENKENIID